jgi:dienelactone hydrolase
MTRKAVAAAIGAGLWLACVAAAAAQTVPQPQSAEDRAQHRQLWLLSIPGERLRMHAYVYRPSGLGPFPLAVINHGSIQAGDVREKYRMPNYPLATQWFLERGYAVVLPQRSGHGETGGPYFEDQGMCVDPDYRQSGLRTADSIQAAIDDMRTQPFVQSSGAVVVGQSAGGWGVLALASRNLPSVAAVVNFAGGRGGRSNNRPNTNCAPDRLVTTAAELGRTARTPTLWLYAENDTYFGPKLSNRMADAYRSAGGYIDYHLLPPSGTEGHLIIFSHDAAALWSPILATFLATIE